MPGNFPTTLHPIPTAKSTVYVASVVDGAQTVQDTGHRRGATSTYALESLGYVPFKCEIEVRCKDKFVSTLLVLNKMRSDFYCVGAICHMLCLRHMYEI